MAAGARIARVAHDVFISYASENKPVADAVCASLECRELRCWIAPRDIFPGQPYPEAIEEAVVGPRLMVVVFSQHAADSRDVRSEIHLAFRQELTIVPFRIHEAHLANPPCAKPISVEHNSVTLRACYRPLKNGRTLFAIHPGVRSARCRSFVLASV